MAAILVIDDNTVLQALVRAVLERAGHTVQGAADGTAGLAIQRQQPADLVLCDLFMPGKEGLETIRELHTEFPQLKIIAISGGSPQISGMDFLPLALHLGAIAALAKPFTAEELTAAVATALQG